MPFTDKQIEILKWGTDLPPHHPFWTVSDINAPIIIKDDFRSILHLSCQQNLPHLVEKLIAHFPEADWNREADHLETPLFIAVHNSHLKIVELLLSVPNLILEIDSPWPFRPPFIEAVQKSHYEITKMLLKDPRNNINQTTSGGCSAIFFCKDFRIFNLLASHPEINLNLRTFEGFDLLTTWIRNGNPLLSHAKITLKLIYTKGINLEEAMETAIRLRAHHTLKLLLTHSEINLPEENPYPDNPAFATIWKEFKSSESKYRQKLKIESHSFFDNQAAELFSLIIFHCDSLFQFGEY